MNSAENPIITQALPAGTRIEEFVIESVLGSGGFGITYLAKDTALGRQVVIKENLPVQFCFRDPSSLTVAPRHSQSDDADNFQWSLENFSKEAAMLASLHHPGIVQVLRSFQAFGTAYFVMPYVEGVTLEDLLQSRQQDGQSFTENELRGLIERVLAALDHLHQRGIYHRDIKPGNILIASDGIPVLIDFGSARQRLSERSMTVVESAGYTPFEQLQTRGRIGPWSDLYAFGATLAKVIAGAAPPKATDRAFDDPWTPLAHAPKWSARYSTSFLTGIDRAMAVRIEERFQDAEEWLEVLKNHTDSAAQLNSSRVSSPSDQPPHSTAVPQQYQQKQTPSPSQKRKPFALVTLAGVLAVVAVAGLTLIGRGRGNTGSDAATEFESRVVAQTAVETPPERVPEQVEVQPPAIVPPASTPSGVPLTTELPPELIEGTPKPMNVPNLLPAPAKAPELLVPAGTVVLSRGKPVTSSDDAPIIGEIALITDGDKEAGEGYFVELLDGSQWVQIDLEQSAAISAIWLWHFHSQKRAYNDVIIQVSDDAEFKTGVTTIYNNDYDDSSKLGKGTDNPYVETRFGKLVDAKGASGRYVRLYSNGNTSNEMNHYIEVEVFGVPKSIEGSAPPRSAKNRDSQAQADAEAKALEAFVLIPEGSFMMGDAFKDGNSDELPVHKVEVSEFRIGKYEVTKALWDKVRTWGAEQGYTDLPEGRGKAENHPVYLINWDDIVKWCNARSEMDGLIPCYTEDGEVYKTGAGRPVCNSSVSGYRLPTEAEWEKAARGGVSGKRFPWGNEISHMQANFNNKGEESYQAGSAGNHPTYIEGTSPVGVFEANGYGLHDMAGNLWEMCSDWYSIKYYASSAAKDPQGPSTGSTRVIRGGSWFDIGEKCRIAERGLNTNPSDRFLTYGFRLARSKVASEAADTSVSDETTAEWETYTNERFGFRFDYPRYLKPGKLPENGAGCIFTDGSLNVTAEAHFMGSQTFDQWWEDLLKAMGKDVLYKVKKSSWAVVSGVRSDGVEFYIKRHVEGGNWAQFQATYPHAMNTKYDPIITGMAEKFIPFLDGYYDRATIFGHGMKKNAGAVTGGGVDQSGIKTSPNKSLAQPGDLEVNTIRVDLNCAPKRPTGNIFSAPDRASIHPDYKSGGGVGTSWSLLASKRIVTTNGTFLSGELISPRGGKMVNGPYYVLESEWED